MKLIAACLAIAFVLVPQIAVANDAPQEDAVQLEKSIEDQASALSTDDCDTACKALASMQRATDRLCKMDPGPSCTKARSVVDSATRRVRDACPACANAFAPSPPPTRAPDEVGTTTKQEDAAQPAPPSESRRGGCAGCDAGGAPPVSDAALIALAWLMTRTRRKRSRHDVTKRTS